jgi:hypothetical protein
LRRTLAWSRKVLRAVRSLPLLDARSAEVGFAVATFLALHDDHVAEVATQGLLQVSLAHL